MKVKIPKRIKNFTVVYTPNLIVDDGDYGQVWFRKELIRIDPCMPLLHRDRSLIHEVLHTIDRDYKCHLDDDNVDRIAGGFLDFLRNDLGIEFNWDNIK